MIESLAKLGISMDKDKTAELGKEPAIIGSCPVCGADVKATRK